jgi:hypothetical protein
MMMFGCCGENCKQAKQEGTNVRYQAGEKDQMIA